jgi:hypothetical protein
MIRIPDVCPGGKGQGDEIPKRNSTMPPNRSMWLAIAHPHAERYRGGTVPEAAERGFAGWYRHR